MQGPYTPQMIVDGAEEFVGSDAARAHRAIALAAQRPKLEVAADLVGAGQSRTSACRRARRLRTSSWPWSTIPEPSAVARGENSGRRLTHISVVKSLKPIGELKRNQSFDARLPGTRLTTKLANQRAIVFAQERGQGRVLGVAEVSVRQSAGIVARWSPQK